ncbi:predicted ATP-binding protein [Algibacter lectus]|uniref:Predicted ATP-binding protein n=1 Tax=Algibacter lectus TaxID=221126 RepID=A0A090WSQ0_9FLAO|nr:AAA family ATPase [Algibacter lectus]GAL80011.1 predicted ATP-binding protein [Algibacter lectus]
MKNVSAIVGGNGSGKTTLIYKIINILNDNFTTGLTIWEDDKGSYFNQYGWALPVHTNGVSIKNITKELGTIYFSPYFDHKASARGIDISADRYLAEDLNNIDSTFDANDRVIISERLKRGDYKRFINFQKSKFSEGVKAAYGLLNEDLYRVVFTRHKIDATIEGVNFSETPNDFRFYLDKLYLNIRKEYDELDRHVASDEERYELNKSQYKNFILMDVFCLLIKLMERKNIYLLEGHFKDKEEARVIIESETDSYSKLKYWLNNYYYSKGVETPLPNDEVISIIDFLFGYIDNLRFSSEGNYLNWASKSLFFDEEDLDQLLDLNENLLIALPKYFLEREEKSQNIYDSIGDLQYFANPEYANRSLSSGETAMLHLYSRLYDFFSRHILNVQTIRKEDYYILFLDEADLAYHPSWKKSYIKTIIDFSVSFFTELDANVQIIFTTHDPLSLSDIPNSNVTYLHKESETRILSFNSVNRPTASFAANVNDLLGHSFFLEDLLIGDFARQKLMRS